jgi:predicted ATP-grasp superfamily ATP-dependent carboligase
MNVPVLLTDGEQRSTLAAVRSLGRAGFRPYVAAGTSRSLAAASRFVRGSAAAADPLLEPDRFVADLMPLIDRWDIRVLLPMTDASHLAVLPARESFPGVCLPCPDAADFERISDKQALLERASSLGIGIPRQVVLDEPGDAPVAGELGFPLVIKPRTSIGGGGAGRARRTASLVPDPDTLATRLRQLPPEAYPVLAQQRIRGPGIGIFLLVWDGELLAAFSHRRLREKPPWGGVSVYRESHELDPTLLDQSYRLLTTHGWRGVAMVEYKLDAEKGQAYLMEVNGRLWGSLQLAIDAGVDFPALLLRAALGDFPRPVLEYRTGVRCRWWWGDVDHLLACVKGGAVAGAQPGRVRALVEFLKLWRPGDRSEVLRVSDPHPFLRESALWLRALR